MLDGIVDFLMTGITAVFSWFTDILSATGMTGFLLAAFFVVLSFRFLLLPWLGGRGIRSDSVKKRYSEEGD